MDIKIYTPSIYLERVTKNVRMDRFQSCDEARHVRISFLPKRPERSFETDKPMTVKWKRK